MVDMINFNENMEDVHNTLQQLDEDVAVHADDLWYLCVNDGYDSLICKVGDSYYLWFAGKEIMELVPHPLQIEEI